MKKKFIALVTEKDNWFYSYKNQFIREFESLGHNVKVYNDHKKLSKKYDVVFLLSYFQIVKKNFLKKNKHNIVIHESDLPNGKGWAPLFWQIIKGRNVITFTTFEANEKVDSGNYYFKDKLKLCGDELYDEIRELQALKRLECCKKIVFNLEKLKPLKQNGKSTYFRRRNKEDSKLNINKSIKSQINLLRSVDNINFPAYFYYKKKKYVLKISNVE